MPSGDSADLEAAIATSLDAPRSILNSLPELFAQSEDLGARAIDVIALLGDEQAPGPLLTPESRVLDLGCGKGAVAIAIAERFGCHVEGIDGMPAFIAHASARARACGVGARCHFMVGDLREHIARPITYDLVVMLALGDLLGDTGETIAALRPCVRPGGHILLDEAYLDADALAPGGPEDPEPLDDGPARDELTASLECQGDRVVRSRVVDGPSTQTFYQHLTDGLVTRARTLATDLARHDAQAARDLVAFAESQRDALAYLDAPIVGALWLLQRGTT